MLPDFLFLFPFPCSADHERDWPPCKESVQHNGEFLPGIILLSQCYYCTIGKSVQMPSRGLVLQPMIPPNKRFDIFPLTGGCSEGL